MPDPTLAEALKEAYAAAPADTVIYHTITLDHSTFATPLYLVRDRTDLSATLETGEAVTFVAYAFDFKRPEVSVGGVPQLVVEIDNVSQAILAAVQAASAATDPVIARRAATAGPAGAGFHVGAGDVVGDLQAVAGQQGGRQSGGPGGHQALPTRPRP